MTLREVLEQEVDMWSKVGHAALLQRFVLKHGTEFKGSPLPADVKRGTRKQCFKNATDLAFGPKHLDYYEGYVLHPKLIMPILHAWNLSAEGKVIDSTLEKPEEYSYLGVKIDRGDLLEHLSEAGVYGVLDTGMINVEYLRKRDSELVDRALEEAKIGRENFDRLKDSL